jgi:hypothetical protein
VCTQVQVKLWHEVLRHGHSIWRWRGSFRHELNLPLILPRSRRHGFSIEVDGLWCHGDCHAVLFLGEKVIRGGDVIVLVHLQTLDGIVARKTEAIELLQYILLQLPVSTICIPSDR